MKFLLFILSVFMLWTERHDDVRMSFFALLTLYFFSELVNETSA